MGPNHIRVLSHPARVRSRSPAHLLESVRTRVWPATSRLPLRESVPSRAGVPSTGSLGHRVRSLVKQSDPTRRPGDQILYGRVRVPVRSPSGGVDQRNSLDPENESRPTGPRICGRRTSLVHGAPSRQRTDPERSARKGILRSYNTSLNPRSPMFYARRNNFTNSLCGYESIATGSGAGRCEFAAESVNAPASRQRQLAGG